MFSRSISPVVPEAFCFTVLIQILGETNSITSISMFFSIFNLLYIFHRISILARRPSTMNSN